jgi:phage repressor protein C with HTH and peptisase S24 domain
MIDANALVKAREMKGFSQPDLARRSGCSQQLIGALEKGTTRSTKFLPKIAAALEVDPGALDSDWAGIQAPEAAADRVAFPPVADPYGPKDFRIYSAAEGGPGEVLRSVEPVDWWPRPIEVQRVTGAYGMYIVGESMVPEYRPGQVAVINPNLPHIADRSYIFYAETEDGSVRATVKLLRRQSADQWFVTQHNPPAGQKNDFTLPKKLWRVAHRIVGRQEPT